MSKKWNASIQFPTDSCFVNRIIEATFGPSASSKNPMLTVVLEVVSPESMEVDGEMVNIAGVKTTNYYVSEVRDSEGNVIPDKTENAQARIRELFASLEYPGEINWNNIDTAPLKGLLVLTQMSPDVEEKTKNPTAKQIAEGRKQGLKLNQIKGDIMKHPVTGQPLINYWPKVREIFGIAPKQDGLKGNVPY